VKPLFSSLSSLLPLRWIVYVISTFDSAISTVLLHHTFVYTGHAECLPIHCLTFTRVILSLPAQRVSGVISRIASGFLTSNDHRGACGRLVRRVQACQKVTNGGPQQACNPQGSARMLRLLFPSFPLSAWSRVPRAGSLGTLWTLAYPLEDSHMPGSWINVPACIHSQLTHWTDHILAGQSTAAEILSGSWTVWSTWGTWPSGCSVESGFGATVN